MRCCSATRRETLTIVAVVGVATALMAGTIGLVQNDIKRVLAYSTVSQLGYMFLAMGVGAYAAGIFHLYTHAFFKALLFLGSGAVIHALGGEQDLRRMGGLKKELPITYWTFLIGALAIAGVPGLAGFFSKDEILFRTFDERAHAAVGDRPADVAADRRLHVPGRVPGVPWRLRTQRTARGTRAAGARTTAPRHRSTRHQRPSARRAAGDGARADRAGGRVRWRRAALGTSASSISSSRALRRRSRRRRRSSRPRTTRVSSSR